MSKPPLPNTPENQTLGVKLAATIHCRLLASRHGPDGLSCLPARSRRAIFCPSSPLLLCRSCHSREGTICATARRGLKPVRRLCFNRLTDDPIHVAGLIRALGSSLSCAMRPSYRRIRTKSHGPSLDVFCMYHVHICTYHVSWIMSSRNKAQPSVPVDPTLRTNEGFVPDRHTPTETPLLPEKSCTMLGVSRVQVRAAPL